MNTLINAYTAGYLDGDGCFYIGTNLQKSGIIAYEYSIQVVSVKIESLLFFKEKFGGVIAEKPRQMFHKPRYCWVIKNKESKSLAINVYDFLKDKKRQCELYVEIIKTIVPNKGIKVSEFIIKQRNQIIESIKEEKHLLNLVTKEKIEALKKIDIKNPSEIDFAYFAGFIDSEGCFRIKRWKPKNKPNYVYAITLEIGNTKQSIFEFLCEKFGGSVVFIPAFPPKKNSATWSISSLSLSQLISKILPHLIIKKNVAEKIMEFYSTTMSNGGDRHSQKFKKIYSLKIIERERIVNEIHNLNLKGLNQ